MATYIDALNGDHTDGREQLSRQRNYVVLYRRDYLLPADPPLAFRCLAEDADHAEEQCLNAEPDADVVWIVDTISPEAAYQDYWNNTEHA